MKNIISDMYGRFGPINRSTQTAGTVITVLVPPSPGALGSAPLRYSYSGTGGWAGANWRTVGRTVITAALYTTAATAHTLTMLRPKNWSYVSTAVAAGGTTIVLGENPGTYSTKYKYPSPITTGTAAVADNGIATGDYVAYQLVDGTWILDTVTVSSLTLTPGTAVPNVTGGGVLANSPVFFFGIPTDKDPATGYADPGTLTIASTNRINHFDDDILGWGNALHPGDPIMLYSNNATNAGSFEGVAGYYSKF